MHYVDGFVLAVPTKNIELYREMAEFAGKIWMRHGAVRYVETVIDDAGDEGPCGISFPKAFDVKSDETTVFAYIVYQSREHRDEVNQKVMKDDDMKQMDGKYKDVFDVKRMVYSGFKAIVEF